MFMAIPREACWLHGLAGSLLEIGGGGVTTHNPCSRFQENDNQRAHGVRVRNIKNTPPQAWQELRGDIRYALRQFKRSFAWSAHTSRTRAREKPLTAFLNAWALPMAKRWWSGAGPRAGSAWLSEWTRVESEDTAELASKNATALWTASVDGFLDRFRGSQQQPRQPTDRGARPERGWRSHAKPGPQNRARCV